MRAKLLEKLRCPSCRASLELEHSCIRGEEIETGTLQCSGCSVQFSISRGIPRFVSTEAYATSFGFQWQTFGRVQLDSYNGSSESEQTLIEKTGLTADEVRGKVVLDAGVGAGRFADVLTRWGAEVVGVDLSLAVDAARELLGQRPNLHLLQADLLHLPFAADGFDYIISLGVLHHTPQPRAAFQALLPYLAPGGHIAIWVYSAHCLWPFRGSEWWRRWTTRMSAPWLYYLSSLAVPLYYVYRIPPFRLILFPLLPISTHPKARWRWLDTFDWYSPKYQWKYTYPEVFQWFCESGLEDVQLLPCAVSLRATKPRVATPQVAPASSAWCGRSVAGT